MSEESSCRLVKPGEWTMAVIVTSYLCRIERAALNIMASASLWLFDLDGSIRVIDRSIRADPSLIVMRSARHCLMSEEDEESAPVLPERLSTKDEKEGHGIHPFLPL